MAEVRLRDVVELWPAAVPASVALGVYDAARAEHEEFGRNASRRPSADTAVRMDQVHDAMGEASVWLQRHHRKELIADPDLGRLRSVGWGGSSQDASLWMVLACSMRACSLMRMFSGHRRSRALQE